MMSYKIEITGFKTQTQAEAFIEWYDAVGHPQLSEYVYSGIGTMKVVSGITFPHTWDNDTLRISVEVVAP